MTLRQKYVNIDRAGLHLGTERFRVEADVAVNRANMLTRLWKYAAPEVVHSEYMMHAGVISMVEFDADIFAAGNCYDQYQYKQYWLFCPYAYRLPEGPILAKDLAVEYKYLSNTSEWFYIARKNAEKVIKRDRSLARILSIYPPPHPPPPPPLKPEISLSLL
ncbi:hypothetical protein M8J76_003101 [Diaphorina citri]|nr:hypothetical protein M8J76_003101 [Diaphorina citri]